MQLVAEDEHDVNDENASGTRPERVKNSSIHHRLTRAFYTFGYCKFHYQYTSTSGRS